MITPMTLYPRKDWDHTPPFFQKAQFRLGLSIAVPMIALPMVGLIASRTPGMGMRSYTVLFAAWMIAGFATLMGTAIIRHQALRRSFRAAGGRLCTHCGYDLRTLGEAGLCPECGQAFDARRDAEAWKRAGFVVSKAARPLASQTKPPSLPVE